MNDVKELCELALDVPAPPLPDAAEAIAVARRATRRRGQLMIGSYGLVLTVAVGVVAATVLAKPATSSGSQAAPVAAAASATVTPPAVLSTTAPTRTASEAHGGAITKILIAGTPAGYTATPEYHAADVTSTWLVQQPHRKGYASLTGVTISAGDRAGELDAFIYANGQRATTGDLCSAEVTATLAASVNDPVNLSCETITINGTAIRVTTQQDAELGEVKTATRFLDGGILQVIAQQGTADYRNDGPLPPDAPRQPRQGTSAHKPALATQPFTSQQLAGLAANPALLP